MMAATLTGPDVAFLTLVVGCVSALAGWLARGATFLSKRWLTGAARQERASFYQSVTDIVAKMKASGAKPDEIAEVATLISNDMRGGGTMAIEVISGEEAPNVRECDEHPAFYSNYAMKMRAGARDTIATAQLEAALTDLRLLLREDEEEYLDKEQRTWLIYREAVINRAYQQYEGGTHAGLAASLAGISETEHRLAQILGEVEDRKQR